MAFLIDTNIISEIQKGHNANPDVQRWYNEIDRNDIFILDQLEHLMGDHVLPVTKEIVDRWAHYNVPDPISVIDGLIAATAAEHDLTLVTRNVKDIERTGVPYLNPFV